jgi:hypothetical protein
MLACGVIVVMYAMMNAMMNETKATEQSQLVCIFEEEWQQDSIIS